MKKFTISGFIFVALIATQPSVFAATIEQARTSLKNYGFVHCLDAAYQDSKQLDDDLAAASGAHVVIGTARSGAYHYMGRGAHFIQQDEDTLDVTHDPYQATEDFIVEAYPNTDAQTQSQGRKNPMIACLTIYNSSEYSAFIRGQDGYISNPEK